MIGLPFTRRGFLGAAAATALVGSATVGATPGSSVDDGVPPRSPFPDHGRVRPPLPLPAIPLTLQDGTATTLSSLLRGRATAIAIMFPTCSTICPVGAATFAEVQRLLDDQERRGIALLSLDIGPVGDRPETLAAWLHRFGARPGWLAASPHPAALQTVQALFDQGRSFSEDHSDRVHIVDRSGHLVWRTYELPAAEDIVALLTQI